MLSAAEKSFLHHYIINTVIIQMLVLPFSIADKYTSRLTFALKKEKKKSVLHLFLLEKRQFFTATTLLALLPHSLLSMDGCDTPAGFGVFPLHPQSPL